MATRAMNCDKMKNYEFTNRTVKERTVKRVLTELEEENGDG